jgi:hypothetical protein
MENTDFPSLNEYRKFVINKVFSQIASGNVLDLNCSANGIFWSLALVERVKQIYLCDAHQDLFDRCVKYHSELEPSWFDQDPLIQWIEFLIEQNLLSTNCSESIAELLLQKINLSDLEQLFSIDISFDHIVAVEYFDELEDDQIIGMLTNLKTLAHEETKIHTLIFSINNDSCYLGANWLRNISNFKKIVENTDWQIHSLEISPIATVKNSNSYLYCQMALGQ